MRIKRFIKGSYALVILILLFLTFYFLTDLSGSEEYHVKNVVDGDSIVLDDVESTKVRYLGIDAPEKSYYDSPGDLLSEESRNLNKTLVDGRKIRLEFDSERYDVYGRTLAYVFVDDILVNEEIVRNGFARALIIKPNDKYADRILNAQDEAKKNRRGIWGDLSKLKPPKGNGEFVIKPFNASRYIDQRVVVRGKISNYRKSNKVMVLKMEDDLDIVLFPDSWSNFGFFNITPEEFYVGKPVEVTGKVRMYKGRPNIIINHPISIRVLM